MCSEQADWFVSVQKSLHILFREAKAEKFSRKHTHSTPRILRKKTVYDGTRPRSGSRPSVNKLILENSALSTTY